VNGFLLRIAERGMGLARGPIARPRIRPVFPREDASFALSLIRPAQRTESFLETCSGPEVEAGLNTEPREFQSASVVSDRGKHPQPEPAEPEEIQLKRTGEEVPTKKEPSAISAFPRIPSDAKRPAATGKPTQIQSGRIPLKQSERPAPPRTDSEDSQKQTTGATPELRVRPAEPPPSLPPRVIAPGSVRQVDGPVNIAKRPTESQGAEDLVSRRPDANSAGPPADGKPSAEVVRPGLERSAPQKTGPAIVIPSNEATAPRRLAIAQPLKSVRKPPPKAWIPGAEPEDRGGPRKVEVHIGTVEVRAEGGSQPESPRPARRPSGFGEYAMLRCYVPGAERRGRP